MQTAALALPIPQAELVSLLREHGVVKAQVFGSFVRNEQRPDSDLDLLVQYEPGISLFDHMDLKELLEKKTGRKVDLLMQIHPSFKPYIEPELVDLGL